MLTNGKRWIGFGGKRQTTEPDGDGGTVFIVTGRCTICLVEREPDHEVIEVPHESVAAVFAHSGLMANRLELRTPRKVYHCWISRVAEESMRTAASFVSDRLHEGPEEVARADRASRVSYRWQPVD